MFERREEYSPIQATAILSRAHILYAMKNF